MTHPQDNRPLDTWRMCGRPVRPERPGSNCTCGEAHAVREELRRADDRDRLR